MHLDSFVDWFEFKVQSDNVPETRAGVYGFLNLKNGKWYIGISRNVYRRTRGRGDDSDKSKLAGAFRKYGRKGFAVIPLLYVFNADDRAFLTEIESALIEEYDSVKNGYNVIKHDQGNGYGEAFKRSINQAFSRPEVIERVTKANRAIMARPGVREKLSKALLEAFKDPKAKLRVSEGVKTKWADPEWKAQMLDARQNSPNRKKTFEGWGRPEARQKAVQTRKERGNLTKGLHTPETIAKRNTTLRDPELQARKSVKQRKTMSDPAYKAMMSVKMKEINSREEVQAKRAESVRLSWERRRAKFGENGRS